MKKIFTQILFVLISSLVFYACKQGGSGKAYLIKMRLNNGDTFHQNMAMNMTMKMMQMETQMTMSTGLTFKVINSTSEGKELDMTYTSSHISMETNKITGVNMDSILNKANKRAVGKKVVLKLSNDNQVTDVTGFENILTDSSMDETTRQGLAKMFSKEQMKSMWGMMFNMYPKKPVRVGDSWETKTAVDISGIEMSVNITCELKSVNNGMANIDVTGVIDGNGKMTQKGLNVAMKMSGDENGTYTINVETGYLDNAFYKMNMKAEMEMMNQKIPMTMVVENTIKSK